MNRRRLANVALVVGLIASLWLIYLHFGGRLDTKILGIRLRSSDAYHVGMVAIVAFAIFAWARRERGGVRGPSPLDRIRTSWPILMILAVAAFVRFWGLTFGLPHPNTRPDEGGVTAIAGTYYYGHWNPGSFNYPPLFMLAIAAVARFVVPTALRFLADFRIRFRIAIMSTVSRFMMSRALSAIAGIATVWVVDRVAIRLFDRTTALVAATFLALAFLHVRDSHFGVTDVPMTFMLMVAFLRIVKMDESPTTRNLVFAAIAIGLAVATKYTALFLIVPAIFAVLADRTETSFGTRLTRLTVLAVIALLAFLVVCPFAVLDYSKFMSDVMFERQHLAEGHGFDMGRGWVYHLTTTLRYGLGVPLLVAGIAGLVMLVANERRKGILVACFPVTFYLIAGSGRTVFFRYMLPMVPFLCLSAGYAITSVARWLAARLRRANWQPALVAALTILVVYPSARSTLISDSLMAQTDSRVLARRWIEARFPPGTTIAQLGWVAGHPFLQDDNEVRYTPAEFTPGSPNPRVVIVHSAPLTGPVDLHHMEDVIKRDYDLAFEVDAISDTPKKIYDQQDEFYLPVAGFEGTSRPGPNIWVYVRRLNQ